MNLNLKFLKGRLWAGIGQVLILVQSNVHRWHPVVQNAAEDFLPCEVRIKEKLLWIDQDTPKYPWLMVDYCVFCL